MDKAVEKKWPVGQVGEQGEDGCPASADSIRSSLNPGRKIGGFLSDVCKLGAYGPVMLVIEF